MARLIDADALLMNAVAISNSIGQVLWSAVSTMDILTAPTVDAVPVVHGRWIEKQEPIPWCEDDVDVFTVCSICNGTAIGEANYCPNCGAHMDLGAKDG